MSTHNEQINMNQEEQQEIQNSGHNSDSRREAFKGAAILGGALIGSRLLTRTARADDTMTTTMADSMNGKMMMMGADGQMMPMMMQDGKMMMMMDGKMMMVPQDAKMMMVMPDGTSHPMMMQNGKMMMKMDDGSMTEVMMGGMGNGMPMDDSMKGMPMVKAMKDPADVDILNYALKLEYLEADFYTRVVAANEAKPYLKPRVAEVAAILKRDEVAHVQAVSDLITKLGGTPIQMPTYQFPEEAFIANSGFLRVSADLEATGVMAYLGQGKRVKSDSVLQFAASIYGIEARHVGLIRYLWGPLFSPEPLEMPKSMAFILAKISPMVVSDPNPRMMGNGNMMGPQTMSDSGMMMNDGSMTDDEMQRKMMMDKKMMDKKMMDDKMMMDDKKM